VSTLFTPYFNPFPKSSVTLFSAPTYTGKSYLVKQILLNQNRYFQDPLTRVFVISCNQQAAVFEFEKTKDQKNTDDTLNNLNFELFVLPLEELQLDSLLPNDLIIFEDVQAVTTSIKEIVNIQAHHNQLAGVFVLCQGLLGTKIFELLSFCHQIVLFLQSTSVSRLANYIVTHFYQDKDLKNYLKTCISYAEKQKTVLLLEINSISSKERRLHIAISHLQHLADQHHPFAVVHPHPGIMALYQKTFQDCSSKCFANDQTSDMNIMPLPETSFLLVPALNVTRCAEDTSADEPTLQCSEWENVVQTIQEIIEENFPSSKWMLVKNLAREILRNKEFCITSNGRMMSLKTHPETPPVPVLDFLMSITRQQGPSERHTNNPHLRKHLVYAKHLLETNTPSVYFKNKYFLSPGKRNVHKRLEHNQNQFSSPRLRRHVRGRQNNGPSYYVGGGNNNNSRSSNVQFQIKRGPPHSDYGNFIM
jgi:hypothetical protein